MSRWQLRRIEDVCVVNPHLPREHKIPDETLVSFVPMAAVDEISGTIADSQVRSFKDVKKSYTHFIDDDVLFAKITPCMENGKAAIAKNLHGGLGFGSTEFHVLRSKGEVLPDWLFYFVRQPRFRTEAKLNFTGTAGQQRVPTTFLASAAIPIPPITEQRRIVDLLTRTKGIVRLRREAEKKAAELIPALFVDMFGDPVTNPKGWATLPIIELCAVQTGGTPSRENAAYYEGEIPWVKTGEVAGGVIVKTGEHISEQALAETNCKRFPIGTVLVAMYGQGQTRGRCAMLGIEASTNQACAAILPSDQIAGEFLFRLLQTQYEHLRSLAQGGNQANLNLSMIKNYRVILPPIAIQNEFVERIGAVSSIQSQQSAATAKAQATFDALLARCFAPSVAA